MSALRMFVVLFCSTLSAAQLAGSFHLEKNSFAPGEPIFLYFEVTNNGKEALKILQADPYSFCAGYEIHVSNDPTPASSCATGFAGSCLSSSQLLAAGKSYSERILLNYDHQVSSPSEYEVEAVRRLPYGDRNAEAVVPAESTLEVRTRLNFSIDESAKPDARSLAALTHQLRSPEPAERREAARVLATLAPRSLEDTLLGFANHPEFRWLAPRAFKGLNTPRSMSALAELLKTAPGTNEHIESARYLAESGDPQWFPLLQEVARHKPQIGNYVMAAAESGGDRAIPLLLELMRSPDKEFTNANAVTGLGYTGSRAAVPILLELLRSPDLPTAQRALLGLRQLTHRRLETDPWGNNPQAQYERWLRWWNLLGRSARIYKPSECGEFELLD
jgi:HEAT repeat protein